jgi:NTP pyrophosphatase (non-canonical NTP hydrolase)
MAREVVIDFANQMEDHMAAHDKERGEEWRGETVAWLLARLKEEIGELEHAFKDCDSAQVAHEAVDVGNFAMMIWSKTNASDQT